jgi:hypothetical protein
MITLVGAIVMVFSLNITAFANEIPTAPAVPVAPGFAGCQFGGWGMGGFGIMWDDDGTTFLGREAFEARVDDLIAQGLVSSADRTAFMERYDWCATYGGGAFGRGFCGGRTEGRGCGRGWRW